MDERQLAIAKHDVARRLSLDPPFVLNLNSADREWEECTTRALEQLGGEIVPGAE